MPSARIISNFNKYLDKATNPLQFEPDADAIRCICEMVDDGMIEAMDVIQGINEKLVDENPHTVFFALEVLDKVFKKLGNLIHKVICTPDYMDFFHEIIVATEHGKIKNKILELLQDWTDKFKYLPQYCAPGNLCKLLQSEGYVFPNSQDLQTNESKLAIKQSSQDMQASCSSLIKSSNIDKEDISKNDSISQTQYEKSLMYYREKKKKDYKIFLKSKGITTSSDEEDVNKFDSTDRMTSTANEKQGKEQSPKFPKELEIIRKQKHQLAASISEVRLLKHEHFMQEVHNYNPELKQCQKKNCEHCKKYCSERNKEEKTFEIPKRLLLPMRKVKESKQAIKDAFEEYKQSKKESYYNKKANNGSSFLNDNNDKVLLKGDEEEETQLKKALLLSQNECSAPEKSMITYENTSEDEQLKIALELSLSEARKNNILTEDQDDDIQEAIDNSFEEAEDKDFCSWPMVNSDDKDVQTNFAIQLSLEEQVKKSSTLEGNNSCIICLEKSSIIKSFQPCNHKCICFFCANNYSSQRCPICRSFFTAIEF